MRITVTRPEQSGLKTAARLKALGHEVNLLPLSDPIYNSDAINEALKQHYSSVAITSAEALNALNTIDFDADVLQKPLLVVGEPSAKAAREFGFQNILTANGFATGMVSLLETMSMDQRNALSPMLYLAGLPRGDTFEDGLARLNFKCLPVDSYQMVKRHYASSDLDYLLGQEKPDAVLFFSSEAVRDYFKLISPLVEPEYFNDVKFLCISAKTAAQLPKNLISQSLISKDTSEQGIIDLLPIISGT